MKSKTRSPNSRSRRKASSSESEGRDYVSIAIAYAEEAIGDRKRKHFGKWIRLAAKRFIADLKRAQGKRPPFVFSAARANHACAFIERLPHVEDVWSETNLIELEPAQCFFLVQLFGFRNEDGSRRFSTALLCVARKNAKSTLAAAILIYCFVCEGTLGPQVISAATTNEQARVVWGIAKKMIEASDDLREAFGLETFVNSIACYPNGGRFWPINSKASTQDGKNPSALSFDELHAHKNHDLFNVVRSAKGARKNPLYLYTTTEGYENPGPWRDERNFAENLLNGALQADHYLALIYAIDDEDSDFDESKWIKANPLLDVSVKSKDLHDEAIEARSKPGSHMEFRIKRLNRRSSSAKVWIDLNKWNRCNGEVVLEQLVGKPCWAAFDLASTTDMTSWWLLWKLGDLFYTWGRYWVPADAVKQRTERRSVNYAGWVGAGLVTQTPGDVADYEVIERDILADVKRFQPQRIAYDPWNATAIANSLTQQGVPLEMFIQGPKSYNPAMQALERAYCAGKFRHGGHPVLRWNAANLVPRHDANMNMAPDRKKAADKIDGIICVIMAFGLAQVDDGGSFDLFLANAVSA